MTSTKFRGKAAGQPRLASPCIMPATPRHTPDIMTFLFFFHNISKHYYYLFLPLLSLLFLPIIVTDPALHRLRFVPNKNLWSYLHLL